jgi:hypothetical protein
MAFEAVNSLVIAFLKKSALFRKTKPARKRSYFWRIECDNLEWVVTIQ